MNILFICSKNKKRSPTAEIIFGKIKDINTRSAGIEKDADLRLSVEDIEWADIIFVMEQKHLNKIGQDHSKYLTNKKIYVLKINDEYDYMDNELINILKLRVKRYIKYEEL